MNKTINIIHAGLLVCVREGEGENDSKGRMIMESSVGRKGNGGGRES